MVKVIDSEKTNVTVWFGSLGMESNVRTTFEYWTRQKLNEDTGNSYFEFHYVCYFENLDTKNWKTEDDGETLECNIGLHQY